MAIFNIVGCLILLVMHADRSPETLGLIVGAFTGQAAVGGFLGAGVREAMRYGIARGLFSNESGLGTAPIVAAAAQTTNPVRQALVSSTGVFWDTVVMCALTGLVIVNSGAWTQGLNGASLSRRRSPTSRWSAPSCSPSGLADLRLRDHPRLVVLRREGGRVPLRRARRSSPIAWLWVVAVMVGSVCPLPAVWSFADIANGLMAFPT